MCSVKVSTIVYDDAAVVGLGVGGVVGLGLIFREVDGNPALEVPVDNSTGKPRPPAFTIGIPTV